MRPPKKRRLPSAAPPGIHADQECEECHEWGPALLMTPLWVHDDWGCWRSWVCPECLISMRGDDELYVEEPWPMGELG